MSDSDPYRPESFWEDAHRAGKNKKGSLGEGIQFVGGGPTTANSRALYRLRAKALGRVLSKCEARSFESVFEFGSGSGFWADYFKRRGIRTFVGCDISQTAVDNLRERFPEYTFFCLAGEPEKAWEEIKKLGPFDLTLSIDVLYHITDDAIWNHALQSLCRVTAPNGYQVICDYFYPQVREIPSLVHVKHRAMQDYLDLYDRESMRTIDIAPIFYFLNRIVDGPWRDHSRIMSVILRTSYRNPLLLKVLEWKDAFFTRLVRPMSPRCKTRFMLLRKV